ncbi:lipopolysaccharide biosynthesis protein [Microbacterium pumilum]
MTEPSLGASASRGAAVTAGAQIFRIGIQLAGIVILARLVTPYDYGMITMILAIIGIGEVLRDFGLAQASIQARTITRGQQSNLFWTNTGVGLVLTIVTIGLSWAIAAFYGTPGLQPLTVVLASTFLLRGMTTQFMAHMARNLRFGRLSTAETVGQLVALGVAIVMALMGFGAWALVAQQVAQAAFTLVIMVMLAQWLPGWIDRHATIRPFLRYGVGVAGSQLLSYASRNVDSVVIGARFGATPLGLYNRAFQLMMLPLSQINAPATRVAVPVLSRLQDERKRFAQFILLGQFATLLLVGSITAICISQAYPVILVFLGPEWLDAAPLFQILAVGGIFQAVSYASYWVFLAKGLTKQNFYYALVTRPIMIGVILLGSMWGVEGVAWAYSLSLAVFWPVSLIWLSRISDAPAREMFLTGLGGVAITAAATAAAWGSSLLIPEGLSLVRIAVGIVVTLATIALIALIFPPVRRQMVGLLELRRHFRRSTAASDSTADPLADAPLPADVTRDPAA